MSQDRGSLCASREGAAQINAPSLSAWKIATALPEGEFDLRARDRNYPWEMPGLADPDS